METVRTKNKVQNLSPPIIYSLRLTICYADQFECAYMRKEWHGGALFYIVRVQFICTANIEFETDNE